LSKFPLRIPSFEDILARCTPAGLLAVMCLVALNAACGGGGGGGEGGGQQTITVSVSPSSVAALLLGTTQQFTATVTGSTTTGVTWSVSGSGCSAAACGTIDAQGLYRAPANLPNPAQVTVRATSVANGTSFGTAIVTISSDITISVNPTAPSIELGAVRAFTATIASMGQPNMAVNWTVAAAAGGSCTGPGTGAGQCGSVDAMGNYTAPPILPAPNAGVRVTATSQADASKSASATVTLTASFTLAIAGPSSVDNAASGQFTLTITPVPGSAPSTAVTWSVAASPAGGTCTGTGTGPGQCGMIDMAGLYTAPGIAPAAPGNVVRVTGTSVADPTKSQTMDVTINILIAVIVSPPAPSVELEAGQTFTASVGGTANTAVTWSVNGIVGGNATVGTVTQGGVYTAPTTLPNPAQVTVSALSQADGTTTGSATVALFSTITVGVSPSGGTRAVNHAQSLSASLLRANGSIPANNMVEWRVNGMPGGSAAVGQICVAGSNPCQAFVVGPADVGGVPVMVDYVAPAAVPAQNPVAITVVSQADTGRTGSAQVTVIPNVQVQVAPLAANVAPSQAQTMTAVVIGTSDQRVSWMVNGIPNGDTTVGFICNVGQVCDPTGINPPFPPGGPQAAPVDFRAPGAPPSPATVNVTAVSADDPVQTASASITVQASAFIRQMLPASITVQAANSGAFLLRVRGDSFSVSPNPSVLRFNNTSLTTICSDLGVAASPRFECTSTIDPASAPGNAVTTPGSYSVQIDNPAGAQFPGLSNAVNLVVRAAAATEAVVALTPANPVAGGQDIEVVEPASAGTGSALQVNIDSIGPLSQGGACTLRGAAVTIQRPSSGTLDFDLCLAGPNTLQPTFTYTISGPSPNDIQVLNPRTVQAGVVAVTLRIPSTAQTGPRTIFAENERREKSGFSGGIEIK
jgi:hypothetical protein